MIFVYLLCFHFLVYFYAGTGYNVNYGNPEAGYVGNLYPASFGMNPVSFPLDISVFVCVAKYVYYKCISE
jgi:hypothetical protein